METRNLTCINCPLGCQITVKLNNDQVVSIEGNTCKRGETYARKEVTNPTRIITSSVIVEDGEGVNSQVSVKTQNDIPKDRIFDVMQALKGVSVKKPVHIGDVILDHIDDLNVKIVATRNVL